MVKYKKKGSLNNYLPKFLFHLFDCSADESSFTSVLKEIVNERMNILGRERERERACDCFA